MLIVSC